MVDQELNPFRLGHSIVSFHAIMEIMVDLINERVIQESIGTQW